MSGLSDTAVDAAFTATQAAQQDRVKWIFDLSHKKAASVDVTKKINHFLIRFITLRLTKESRLDQNSGPALEAPHVEALPVPKRARFVPYTDELPAVPLKGDKRVILAAVAALLFICYMSQFVFRGGAWPTQFLGEGFKTVYTGVDGVDMLLTYLVSAFSSSVTGTDPAWRVHMIYFLAMVAPWMVVRTVESYRQGVRLCNYGSFASMILWYVKIPT